MVVCSDAVLAVIRASRPTFKSAHDRVAFAIHATFSASGYSLIAAGSRASTCTSAEPDDDDISPEGWNDIEDSYVFRYGGTRPDMWKVIEVKAMPLGDMLMVDAAPISSEGSETIQPCHLAIKVSDFASCIEGKNYSQQYINLEGLVNVISSSLLEKMVKPSQSSKASSSKRAEHEKEEPGSLVGGTRFYRQPKSVETSFPPVPVYGGSDLTPGLGAGIFQPRGGPSFGGPGGSLLGPNDPLWGRMGQDRAEFPGQDLGVNVPPGARFDPFGPPGVPGFEPNRFGGGPRRSPGHPHPDLEHFQPFQ